MATMRLVNEEFLYKRLVQDLAANLSRAGSVMAWAGDIQVTPEQWRKAARAAAASIGRKVRTVQAGSSLHAWLPDWPANEAEQEINDRQMREAAQVMASVFDSWIKDEGPGLRAVDPGD